MNEQKKNHAKSKLPGRNAAIVAVAAIIALAAAIGGY